MISNLPTFEHLHASSIENACSTLAEHQGQASVIAGGTDLLVRMKYRASVPKVLVDLKRIPNLSGIEEKANGDLVIGAFTKLHDIEASPRIRDRYPLLSMAAGKVANHTIRNMGTLGGNLCSDARCEYFNHSHLFGLEYWPKCFKRGGDFCHLIKKGNRCYARYSADTAPALVALSAKARIVSPQGDRTIAVEDFFTGSGHPVNVLQPGEILTEIQIPKLYSNWKGIYLKYSYRETTDYPIVGVAILMDLEGDLCKAINMVAISVASAPVKIKGAQKILEGARLNDSVIADAVDIVSKEVNPIPHHGESPSFIKQSIAAYVKKALYRIVNSSK